MMSVLLQASLCYHIYLISIKIACNMLCGLAIWQSAVDGTAAVWWGNRWWFGVADNTVCYWRARTEPCLWFETLSHHHSGWSMPSVLVHNRLWRRVHNFHVWIKTVTCLPTPFIVLLDTRWKLNSDKEFCTHFQIMCGSFEKRFRLVQVFQDNSTPGERDHYCVWTGEFRPPCYCKLFFGGENTNKSKSFSIVSSVLQNLTTYFR